jgi:hypothetical protein
MAFIALFCGGYNNKAYCKVLEVGEVQVSKGGVGLMPVEKAVSRVVIRGFLPVTLLPNP